MGQMVTMPLSFLAEKVSLPYTEFSVSVPRAGVTGW